MLPVLSFLNFAVIGVLANAGAAGQWQGRGAAGV
jgi:hypothetical protein